MNLPELHPTSVVNAIDLLFDNLSDYDVAVIRRTEPGEHHHFFGQELRNAWIHGQPNSPLVLSCLEVFGVSMADDISNLILSGLWGRVNGAPVDLVAKAEGYRAHWIACGCDPTTGQPA